MQEPKHCLTERNWCHLLVLGLNTASAMSCQNSDDATILLLGKIYFFWSSITADNSHTSFILNKKDRYPLWWLSSWCSAAEHEVVGWILGSGSHIRVVIRWRNACILSFVCLSENPG